MLSERMAEMLNQQIQKELYSEYFYLSMKAYFADENLDGFANFFDVQVKEERFHAMKFFDYVIQAGSKVTLETLEAPPNTFTSAEDVFQKTYDHEKFVTESIYKLVDLAIEERDHKTNAFLQWFVNEQIEEEATMDGVLKKLKLINNDPNGLFALDTELAKRVFNPPLA